MDMDIKEFREEWKKKRESIESFDDLVQYLTDVKNASIGYDTAPELIADAAAAVAWWFSCEWGITGFQASWAGLHFLLRYLYIDNKAGIRVLDFDKLLYPQYVNQFKDVSRSTWEKIKEMATERLSEDDDYVSNKVLSYWKKIVDGYVPEGLTIVEGV